MRRRPREQWKRIKEDWSWDRRMRKKGAGRKRRRAGGRDWRKKREVRRQKRGSGTNCKTIRKSAET